MCFNGTWASQRIMTHTNWARVCEKKTSLRPTRFFFLFHILTAMLKKTASGHISRGTNSTLPLWRARYFVDTYWRTKTRVALCRAFCSIVTETRLSWRKSEKMLKICFTMRATMCISQTLFCDFPARSTVREVQSITFGIFLCQNNDLIENGWK